MLEIVKYILLGVTEDVVERLLALLEELLVFIGVVELMLPVKRTVK